MTRARAVNYALYQTGWFACILGAAWGWPVAGAAIATVLIAVHFAITDHRGTELALLLLTLALGVLAEAIQVRAGTYTFRSGVVAAWMSPPWLLLMWAQFATTFRSSLRAIMTVPGRAAVFGALGGPIAFIAGERLGAVTLAVPVAPALLRLAVVWGVAMTLCALAARRTPEPPRTRRRWVCGMLRKMASWRGRPRSASSGHAPPRTPLRPLPRQHHRP